MVNFDFDKEYSLENNRVLLRPLIVSDSRHLLPFAHNEPILWQYSLQSAAGETNMLKYIESAIEKRNQKDSYAFLIFDKTKNTYTGSTRFYDFQKTHKTTQLGYTWIGKDFQGTGLNVNCKFLLLRFAFETIGLERVEFRADFNNKRSIAAMKGIGCVEEGILRSNYTCESGRRNSIVLSILKNEWESKVKAMLTKKIG